MPKKLQIKLLSQSAELLSMTNCSAGQISVLRAESPTELRPYQRALAGTQGRERFIITVDGKEYSTEHHNLIGFGEVAPHSGLTVGQFLASTGLIEGAISGLLMAFGIEGIETKLCSALSPDEERKVRIFAATADPTKALVLNEPFEPISTNWRERMAEFLTDFARTKNGLVVVASLSYRPDSWIDNPVIARHQVGQSLRRTIGFGAAGSDSNQLINQLRDQIRKEESEAVPTPPPPPIEEQAQRPQAAAMSLGAAAMMTPLDTSTITEMEEFEPSQLETIGARPAGLIAGLKAGAVVGAGGLGVWAALALLGIYPAKEGPSAGSQPTAVAIHGEQQSQGQQTSDSGSSLNAAPGDVAKQAGGTEKVKVAYILDRYPEPIRISVLDTSRGVMGEASLGMPVEAAPVESQKAKDQSGNFYKLLESAGTDKADAPSSGDGGWQPQENTGAWDQGESPETSEFDPGEEEERREAIRQKFLEAIRAAAERREQEGMDQ